MFKAGCEVGQIVFMCPRGGDGSATPDCECGLRDFDDEIRASQRRITPPNPDHNHADDSHFLSTDIDAFAHSRRFEI